MPNYFPVSRDRYAGQRWRRHTSYAFSAREALVPIVAAELSKVVMAMPLAFIEQAGAMIPVAVLGLQPGVNLFVGPDGRWRSGYVPAILRAYPFRLAKTDADQYALCFDEDSGLLTQDISAEAFFSDDGEPAPAVAGIMKFLTELEKGKPLGLAAGAVLQKHGLLCPWPLVVKTEAGEQPVGGLFQVDEAALNLLSGEALAEVFQSGALSMAYCQLLSRQHVAALMQATAAQAKVAQASKSLAPNGELNLEFFNNNGTISFAGLL